MINCLSRREREDFRADPLRRKMDQASRRAFKPDVLFLTHVSKISNGNCTNYIYISVDDRHNSKQTDITPIL